MDAIKNLVVVGRRSRTTSVVSDDDDENYFCYHRHDPKIDGDEEKEGVAGIASVATNDKTFGCKGSCLSLYGRRCSASDLMAVVTSNKFDSDEAFLMVSRNMMKRYESENMSEREAIHATLGKSEDKRAFIEALDLRYATLLNASSDYADFNHTTDDAILEAVHQTRSIFDVTLKSMWREESVASSSPQGMTEQESTFIDVDAMIEQQRRDDDDEHRRQHQPKAPKNLRMSPMQSSFKKYSSYGGISRSESCDSGSSEGNNSCNIFQPLKRRRRWFFAENGKTQSTERPVTPPSPQTNHFPIKALLPKFHFDFGGSSNSSSKNKQLMFGGINHGARPVQSLRLDGSSSSLSYMPPTSPIRKLSAD